MKIKETKNAVSEIISTILLLAIASSFLGVMYLTVLTPPVYSPPPITNIAGKILENNILLSIGQRTLQSASKEYLKNLQELPIKNLLTPRSESGDDRPRGPAR